MTIKNKQGFTLIEMLIVVAIIAILASIILVGLGPTQSLGRDARRVSDLHEVQNGLELYYSAKGQYPIASGGAWTGTGSLSDQLTNAGLQINSVPNDPTANTNYQYGTDTGGTTYIVAAVLENGTGGEWDNYPATAPANYASVTGSGDSSIGSCAQTDKDFCLTL